MSAQLDLFAAPQPHFAAVSASIASAGGYHCESDECGAFVVTRQWDGVKLCADCRVAASAGNARGAL